MASGWSRLRPLKPKSLTLAAWIQKATGGLSTVTKAPGSKAMKKKLRQLCVMLFTGCRVIGIAESNTVELKDVQSSRMAPRATRYHEATMTTGRTRVGCRTAVRDLVDMHIPLDGGWREELRMSSAPQRLGPRLG